jgi:hypothetical protein
VHPLLEPTLGARRAAALVGMDLALGLFLAGLIRNLSGG